MNAKRFLFSLLVTLVFGMVLCSTFVNYGGNDCYFLLYPFAVSLGVASLLAVGVVVWGDCRFRFSLPDILITIAVGYYVARYDFSLRLADWKVIYAALLLILWYVARIVFSSPWVSRSMFSVGVAVIGCALTGWGLLQLYGYCHSNHFLYKITGPFLNPGPYSGYLAMLLPLCLHGFLTTSVKWLRRFYLFSFGAMLCIIPAAMSRSAWIAIAGSLLLVGATHHKCLPKLLKYFKVHPYRMLAAGIVACLLVVVAGVVVFQFKADSAYGRLFIWKNTLTVVSHAPWLGHGPGSFQREYGTAQAAYFRQVAQPKLKHV